MGKESNSSTFSVLNLLNQTVSEPHYLFHFLTFFSYIIVRCSASQVLAPHLIQILIRREIQTLLVFAVLAFIKGIREETWEAFIAEALFIAKICLFILTFTMDRRIAVWYTLVFLVIHVLTQPLHLCFYSPNRSHHQHSLPFHLHHHQHSLPFHLHHHRFTTVSHRYTTMPSILPRHPSFSTVSPKIKNEPQQQAPGQ
ncbi:unnamed protein product [Vicia faba]|uniref:Uncharacterized protein n=1 Tax=Vicia faba TaxID=3906 RepID=A0AAV0Z892_VICFA|nr:unnamed protein product [Vicia faba]